MVSRAVPSRTSAHSNASHQYFIADIPHVNSRRFYNYVIPTVAATTTPLDTSSLQECSTEWTAMRRNFYFARRLSFFLLLITIVCVNKINRISSDVCLRFKTPRYFSDTNQSHISILQSRFYFLLFNFIIGKNN